MDIQAEHKHELESVVNEMRDFLEKRDPGAYFYKVRRERIADWIKRLERSAAQ